MSEVAVSGILCRAIGRGCGCASELAAARLDEAKVLYCGTVLDITKDIRSLTEFRRNSAAVKHLKHTRRRMVLTVNGKAEIVVQDAESYQRLLDIAAAADADEGIRQGIAGAAPRRTRARSSTRFAATMAFRVE